jgi:pimeloyl-ACP methyl ester carboxylesterase
MKHIYILSGLGADEKVFVNLNLPGYILNFIRWIPPLPNEDLTSYATRLKTQITTLEPVLIGLSFGGIMAIEISRQMRVRKIILISSVKTRLELPFHYRLAGALRLERLIPGAYLRRANAFYYKMFGLETKKEKKLLDDIFRDTGESYFRWAIGRIMRWKNMDIQRNVFHIHGNDDRILPVRFVNADMIVDGGGHFMVYNRAEEIATFILGKLADY